MHRAMIIVIVLTVMLANPSVLGLPEWTGENTGQSY